MDKILQNIEAGIAAGLAKAEKKSKYVSCPFCHEDDFDLEGLKNHLLNGWCNEFNEIRPCP